MEKKEEAVEVETKKDEVEVEKEKEEKRFDVETPVHNVLCSSCEKAVRGTRWKCFHCVGPALNLCDECIGKDNHNPLHPFVRILRPDQCPDTGALSSNYVAYQLVAAIGTDAKDPVEPGETFFSGWRMKNASDKPWSQNLQIRRWGGRPLDCEPLNVPSAAPGAEVDLLLELRVPVKGKSREGKSRSLFRLYDGNEVVGSPLVVEINIDNNKMLRLAKKEAAKVPFQDELSMLHSMGFKDRARLTQLFQSGKTFAEVVEMMIIEAS